MRRSLILAPLLLWSCNLQSSREQEARWADMEETAAPADQALAPAKPSLSSSTVSGLERKGARQGKAVADDTTPPEAPKPKRMVHYNGFLRLRVTQPSEALQQASELAGAAGGYVESLTATTVTLRVPVARFRSLFDRLATIGDVLSRSMTAQDVTDAYIAMDLRVETLKASRTRLIALLGKAKKTREKLRLLGEIQRLTEEIDQLEMHLGTLASLAELSRLTLEAVPHQVHVGRASDEPIASFRWIHHLSPFSRDIALRGDRLELAVPEGMVALSDTGAWVAESADGAVLWTAEHEMTPAGDTSFWLQAVRLRLEQRYGNAEVIRMGEFQVVRVVDTGEKAYRYLVGVRATDTGLQVVEVYYPGPEQERRYGAGIRAAISGGAS